MEIRDWAEKIFYGKSLEDKLCALPSYSDKSPVSSLDTYSAPARADRLAFSSIRKPFPSLSELEKPNVKAEILHYFANHELLALELMAMALLRFPDSPPAFRKGLVKAMKEEQEHMSFYIENMRQLGMDFGDLPLSDFFWKSIYKVESPYHFICNLSLCLEQANLDYSIYFKKAFDKVGDKNISSVLYQVYLDEISHVAFGFHWFQKWKPEGRDWDCHKEALVYPLTLRRAKGKLFDLSARKKIGFSQDYIDNLKIYESSRGKIPNVYEFLPEVEILASGKESPARVEALKKDLAMLMMVLSDESDLLLLSEPVTKDCLLKWKELGLPICEIQEKNSKPKYNYKPWGVAEAKYLSKQNTVDFLDHFYKESRDADLFLDRLLLLSNENTFIASEVVLKPELGASGRGIIFSKDLTKSLSREKYYYEKRFFVKKNISFHFKANKGKIRYLGWTEFETNKVGNFKSVYLNPIDFPLNDLLKKNNHFYSELVDSYVESLAAIIPNEYSGPISLDAMLVDEDGSSLFHPCNDLNIRYTMGRLALEMKKYIKTKNKAKLNFLSFSSIAKKQKYLESHPELINKDAKSNLYESRIYLNDSIKAKNFLAELSIDYKLPD